MVAGMYSKGRKIIEAYVLVVYDPDYGKVMDYTICPSSREDGMSEEEDLRVFAYIDDEILATQDCDKILEAVVEVTGISLIPVEAKRANPNVNN